MYIQFYDACKTGDSLLLSACNFNGLFRYNLKTEELLFVSHFPHEKMSKKYLHSGVIKQNNKVFFIPYMGCGISSFDLKRETFEFEQLCDKDSNNAFVFPLIYKDQVIIIPSDLSREVYKLDDASEMFFVDRRLTETIDDLIKSEPEAVCDLAGCAIHGSDLIIGLFGKSKILKINIESGDGDVLRIDGITVGNLIFYNNTIWNLSDGGGKCQNISNDGSVLCEYDLCGSSKRGYQLFITHNRELYLLGCVKDSLLKFVDGCWVEVVNNFPKEYKRVTEWAFLSGSKVIDKELYLFPASGNGIVKIDPKENYSFMKTYSDDFPLDRLMELKCKDMKADINSGLIMKESSENDISSFLACLSNDN